MKTRKTAKLKKRAMANRPLRHLQVPKLPITAGDSIGSAKLKVFESLSSRYHNALGELAT